MKNFLNSLLDWIYKKKCYICSSSKESLKMCSSCFDELDYLEFEKSRQIFESDVYCAGKYEGVLQKLIRGIKYHNQRELAYYQAKFMYNYWSKINIQGTFCIVPIPLYKEREKQRKYNHMAIVAEEFSKLTGYNVNLELVKRVKDTKPQYKLNRGERMQNLSNAFRIQKEKHTGAKILLFDDICTTGSTFENIILELNKSGISDIVCFATTTPF